MPYLHQLCKHSINLTDEENMHTSLDTKFIDQIPNFAHLVTTRPQTKEEFLLSLQNRHSLADPKTRTFFVACEKSYFNTIKLSNEKDRIIFN